MAFFMVPIMIAGEQARAAEADAASPGEGEGAVIVQGRPDTREGELVYVPQAGGRAIPARIVGPCFYDPEGQRQHVD